jgi:hypothetical protein
MGAPYIYDISHLRVNKKKRREENGNSRVEICESLAGYTLYDRTTDDEVRE